MIDLDTTIARAVADHSVCAAVFQRHRIDFCCKGERTIAVACQDRGLDAITVVAELNQAIDQRAGHHDGEPASMSTPQLIGHILATHHAYLREALPLVLALSAKVGRVHGERDPRLVEVARTVKALADDLGSHLEVEESGLFPALLAHRDRAAIAAELATMVSEHVAVGALLGRLRAITDDYEPPAWACRSYQTLFAELAHLEGDILRHVHLENHVLAPRFA
jgi:regulator of cell morphogenesis and NO signaling